MREVARGRQAVAGNRWSVDEWAGWTWAAGATDAIIAGAMNLDFYRVAVRVWATEILVSGFNYFVLMNLVYEPLWGDLRAHQVGMSTRIVYIFVFAYLLLRYAKRYDTRDLVQVGMLWLALTLIFEWGGSFMIGRPVDEILVGWHIEDGRMWPYVLLAYTFSNLIVGLALHPRRAQAAAG